MKINHKSKFFKFIAIALISLIISQSQRAESDYNIHEIYISGGSNSYEAKEKAKEEGVIRSFKLLADKIGITQKQASKIPPEKIKESVKDIDYVSQNEFNKGFEAVINVSFHSDKIDSLLLSTSKENEKLAFDRTLLIPLLKQGGNYLTLEADNRWAKFWKKHEDNLEVQQVTLLNQRSYIEKFLNHKVLKNINYAKIHEVIREFKSWKAVIVLGEYFTDHETGRVSLQIDRIILEPDSKRVLNQRHSITTEDDVKNVISQIIEEITSPNKD